MIQAIGLTSAGRRHHPPAVDDLTFEARPGRITALFGPSGAGKTTALRLMLRLEPGRGIALFRGRPLHRIAHPHREIGVLLGDVPGHPGRTARNHLRMLAAAAGVPAERADELLDAVGLGSLAGQRIGRYSLGMGRRLALAAALLGDPYTLVLDAPGCGLSPRETSWLHGLLRGYAAEGGTVLVTSRDTEEAAGLADRVVTLETGRLAADQDADAFARARLRPRVTVRSPHAERLAALLTRQSRASAGVAAERPLEVVRDGGSRLVVYGSDCATVGETAYRNGILVHQLADEAGDTGTRVRIGTSRSMPPVRSAPSEVPYRAAAGSPSHPSDTADEPPSGDAVAPAADEPPAKGAVEVSAPAELPRLRPLPPPGPAWPLRYEVRRFTGIRTGWLTAGAGLLAALVTTAVLARSDGAPTLRLFSGWPGWLPLPPAAAAAGVLGALSFGQEFRHPATACGWAPASRRLGLLAAKLLVTAVVSALLCLVTAALTGAVAMLSSRAFGPGLPTAPAVGWPTAVAACTALAVGCGWAGVLVAGAFKSTAVGAAAVPAVPLLVLPVLREVPLGPAGALPAALPGPQRPAVALSWTEEAAAWLSVLPRLADRPVGALFALALVALLSVFLLSAVRGGIRWPFRGPR